MKVYISNCTLQNHVVQARIPEMSSVVIQDIAIGSQVMFGGPNLSSVQIEAIIEQLRPYGLAVADEVQSGKMSGKVLLVARRDQPVTADLTTRVHQHNHGMLQKEGIETRKNAAIGMNTSMASRAQIAGLPGQTVMDMSIIEQTSGTINDDADVSEGIRVTARPDEHPLPPAQRRRGRGQQSAVQ